MYVHAVCTTYALMHLVYLPLLVSGKSWIDDTASSSFGASVSYLFRGGMVAKIAVCMFT